MKTKTNFSKMHNTIIVLTCLLVIVTFSHSQILDNSSIKPVHHKLGRGINGGFSCAACTVLISLSEQLAQINNETTADALQRMCTYLPDKYRDSCHALLKAVTPLIIRELLLHTSPDTICYGIGICHVDPGKDMCHLFPLPTAENEIVKSPSFNVPSELVKLSVGGNLPWICYIPGVSELCQAIVNVYDQLVPAIDYDDDKFSPAETLRGSIWRGRDCSDIRNDIYPGRNPLNGDLDLDSNCNGIFGVNRSSGLSLEEELCGGSGRRGIIYIGDSVAAHFHAPPTWFNPALLTTGILANLSYVISNEGDWPDLGFATGFRNSTMPALIETPTDSIYLRLRERNLCNHRDYQNLGRNGAESNSTDEYVLSLSRDRHRDAPALVFYSLVGNDVCNEMADTEAHMTPPEVFYNNTLRTLRFLDSHLPPGSHVMLVGLIDGTIIYEAMGQRYHPLGELNKDLKYKDVYHWFNCMEMGPCHGWMTSNSTLRRLTTKHARQLTRVLKHVASKEKFVSFDLHFVENPFRQVIDAWLDDGGELWELIEPVDSLHPTQAAQTLIAQQLWRHLEKNLPHVLGPVNPRNDVIRQLFKDQGGH